MMTDHPMPMADTFHPSHNLEVINYCYKKSDEIKAEFWTIINEFYVSGKFCDLFIVCRNRKLIRCHRIVLSAVCRNLEVILKANDCAEADVIYMPDYSDWEVKAFIDNLYFFFSSNSFPGQTEDSFLFGTKNMFEFFGFDCSMLEATSYIQPKMENQLMEGEEEMTELNPAAFPNIFLNEDPYGTEQQSNLSSNSMKLEVNDNSAQKAKKRKSLAEDYYDDEDEEEEDDDEEEFDDDNQYYQESDSVLASSSGYGGKKKKSRKVKLETQLDLDENGEIKKEKKKRIRYPEPKPQSILRFDDKINDPAKTELFNQMQDGSSIKLDVTLMSAPLQVSLHCNKYHREASFFQALVGIVKTEFPNTFQAKPLAWSYPESSDISKQFDCTIEAFRTLYGFSTGDMYYNGLLYSRQGLYKLNRSKKVKHELKRKYAKMFNEELDELLEREDIIRATNRDPIAKPPLHQPEDDTICQIILNNNLNSRDLDGVAHLVWPTGANTEITLRQIQVTEESRDEAKKDCLRVLFDVWCIGRGKLRIPDSQYLRNKYNELMETMETLSIIQDFKMKDPEGKERSEMLKKEKQCADCGMVFPCVTVQDEFKFNTHRRNHFYENYECDCNETFDNFKQKKTHVQLVHSNGRFTQCQFCSFVGTKPWMAKHLANDHKETAPACYNSCICEQCGKELSGPRALYSHTLIHKEYKCNVCGEKIIGYSSFCTHRKNAHSKKKESYPCSACGKTFPSKMRVREHFGRIHMEDKDRPKQCPDCDRGFVSSRALGAHRIMAHLKTRPYKCRWGCGADYNDLSSRGTHEKKKHGKIFPWERPTGTAKV